MTFRIESDILHELENIRALVNTEANERAPIIKTESNHGQRLLEREVRHWRKSPYCGLLSSHFLQVTRDGDFFYYFYEKLQLNENAPTVTTRIDMKHTKIHDYIRENAQDRDIAQFLRDRWIFHYFRIRDADGGNRILDEGTDNEGITTKSQIAKIKLGSGYIIEREAVAHLRQYAQFHTGINAFDSAQFDQRIPFGCVEFVLVIDEELYRETTKEQGAPQRGVRMLKANFGSLEWEPQDRTDFNVSNERISTDQEYSSAYPDAEGAQNSRWREEYLGAVQNVARAHTRATRFVQAVAGSGGYAPPELPPRYYFYTLNVPYIGQGERMVVVWPRPVKPSG